MPDLSVPNPALPASPPGESISAPEGGHKHRDQHGANQQHLEGIHLIGPAVSRANIRVEQRALRWFVVLVVVLLPPLNVALRFLSLDECGQ